MIRVSFLKTTAFAAAAITIAPSVALATNAEKEAFIRSCDESININRLAGAPRKFVGKHVDLRGQVGEPTDGSTSFNFASDSNSIVVVGDASSLEQEQSLRVLGVVQSPQSLKLIDGGESLAALVQARYVQ